MRWCSPWIFQIVSPKRFSSMWQSSKVDIIYNDGTVSNGMSIRAIYVEVSDRLNTLSSWSRISKFSV